jgi:ABC-type Fe3+ transport system permease subunit
MTRAIGLVLLAPLAGFALEAALGAGEFRLHARAWGTTLAVAGVATTLGLLLGIPTGLALAHTQRSVPRTLTILPLLLPPVLAAAAWLGARLPAPGAAGCGVILGAIYWPVVALLLDASLRRLPADAVDAAALQLAPSRMIRLVVWPHVRPAIFSAALLVFLLAASEFTVPALFIVPTISMTIYEEMSAFRTASAASAALPLLALGIGLAFALRRVPMIPPAKAARTFLTGAPLAGVRSIAGLVWLLTAIAPAAIFAARAGSFFRTISMNVDAILWSGAIAGATALLLVAWASLSPRRSRLEPLWLATLALPGVVAGFGALQMARHTNLLPVLGPGGALLVIALMARFAFAAWLPLREPVDRGQLEAAELSGLSPVRTWWRITAPALLPKAAAAGAIVFVLALGEIGPVVLLSPPGRLTASQHLFNLMHYGYDEVVASIALLLFGATALVTWSGMHVGRLRTNRLAA